MPSYCLPNSPQFPKIRKYLVSVNEIITSMQEDTHTHTHTHTHTRLVAQSCSTLFDPMDCSLPGSSVLEFSRQEYWSGLPCPPPGDLPDLGREPMSLALRKILYCCITGDKITCSVIYTTKAMASHSSTLAWKIPWTEEPGRLQSMGSQRVGYSWVTYTHTHTHTHTQKQPTCPLID